MFVVVLLIISERSYRLCGGRIRPCSGHPSLYKARGIVVAHFSGELTDHLLVDAFHFDLRVAINSDLHFIRDGVKNGV